ncbi:MAG TPA: 6,7-dimethyl-8-ribityllumazine synthase [Methylomirabilota bacterium]|nr:6,7-dimethyl-8-ribityllumazine synthase [Methylomirabilota bacterium]
MAGRAPRARRPDLDGHRAGGGGAGASGLRFAVVAARFNEGITKRLLDGALRSFAEAGVAADAVDVHWVPGSFELPQAAGHLAATGRYAAVVCLGCVIRGQTPHFEHVAREAAAGISHVALTTGVPASFGLITANDEEQAWQRAGGEVGNRGEEAAAAAFEMASFVRDLGRAQPDRRGGGARRSRPGGT